MLRKFTCLLLALALAACHGSPAYIPAPPASGHARLVMMYPARAIGSGEAINTDLNGASSCKLTPGSYAVREVAPGPLILRFAFCGLPKNASVRIMAAAGSTYYVRVTPYDTSLLGKLSGYADETSPDSDAKRAGGFEIKPLKESQALAEMADMQKTPD